MKIFYMLSRLSVDLMNGLHSLPRDSFELFVCTHKHILFGLFININVKIAVKSVVSDFG